MSFESPKRKYERVPIAKLDEFEAIDINNLNDSSTKEIRGALRGHVSFDAHTEIELLRKEQEDGTVDYLACGMSENKSCRGVMIDSLGTEVIGSTSFNGSTISNAQNVIRVGQTYTDDDMRGLGLATRRLVTINSYLVDRFGRVLHSSSAPSSAAEKVWEDLKEKGLVEVDDEDMFRRYAFKQTV